MLLDFRRKKEQLVHCLTIAEILTQKGDLSLLVDQAGRVEKTKDNSLQKTDDDGSPKDTKAISLDFFQDGLSIEEIAKKRDMVVGTIYGHLIHYVGAEVEATDLLPQEKIDKILAVLRSNVGKSSSEIKLLLGADFDYPDIKIGQKLLELESSKD